MRKLGIALLGAIIATPAFAADITVAVTAIVEHPALDAARDGIKEGLAAEGYADGKEIDFIYQSAQGAPATAAQIARQFVGDNVTVIVPISTPSAQAAAAATKDIPIVFTAVTDPIAAELVATLEKPGGNITGISDMSPMADHVALIKEITPNVKSIGVLFNPGEANSVSLVDRLKEVASGAGLAVVEAPVTKSADVQAVARSLVGKVDAMYVPTDNTVVSALEAAIAVADENDIPFYAGDTDSVKRGALASIGFNYFDVGVETGKVVARVLKGEKPGDIDVTFASGTDLFVNKSAAEKMGVTIPEAVIARANTVIE
ncbi:MAG: ABC transporter substrate-binding protein [Bauldia sp.]|nr:ABC transporter substrate-binding protein [Bauldia sp.]